MTSTQTDPTPVEIQIGGLLQALDASQKKPDPRFTVASLISALGVHAHIVVILVLSVLNMVPGPPGYGGTIAFAIIGISLAMLFNRPLTLPGWIRRRKLPATALRRVTKLFARMAAAMGRISRPRFTFVSAPALQPALALFIIAVSLPMMMPIPFINAVPNTGICILCLGWINRDAVVIVAGIVIALVGLAVAAAAIWGVWHLANAAIGAVQ
jgi:hypothetical protein